MKKVMVYNFKAEQYEQATEEEGKDLLGLIDDLNADCAAQQERAADVCPVCEGRGLDFTLGQVGNCICGGSGKRR